MISTIGMIQQEFEKRAEARASKHCKRGDPLYKDTLKEVINEYFDAIDELIDNREEGG